MKAAVLCSAVSMWPASSLERSSPPANPTNHPSVCALGCCRGMLIVGIVGLVSVIIGLLGSLRANCCVTLYLWLGSLLTLGAWGGGCGGTGACGVCTAAAACDDKSWLL